MPEFFNFGSKMLISLVELLPKLESKYSLVKKLVHFSTMFIVQPNSNNIFFVKYLKKVLLEFSKFLRCTVR